MTKKVWLVGLTVVGIFILSGCAMMNKNDALLNQGLRNKILALETQLKEKDDEIYSLKESSLNNNEDINVNKVSEVNQQVDLKLIQTALKNAGYYQSIVDGKMGRKTRKAVRDFQKANNLPVDGQVGKNTWLVLKEYLEKKVK